MDPVLLRRRVGMVFQKPNPFPTMSIRDNVVAGLKLQGVRSKKTLDEVAERSLKGVIPPPNKFPYTIRLVSEILESNGSSSMA